MRWQLRTYRLKHAWLSVCRCSCMSLMITSSNGNIFRVIGPLGGESTDDRWNFPHKVQWRGALIFSLICAWANAWANNRDAGDLRRHHAHYDVTVMCQMRSIPRSLGRALMHRFICDHRLSIIYNPFMLTSFIPATRHFLLTVAFRHCSMPYMPAALAWLTHWDRVTHVCVSKLSIIGSDNGLSPYRRQAIIWTNAGILWI